MPVLDQACSTACGVAQPVQIVVTARHGECDATLAEMLSAGNVTSVGFDTETKPVFRRGAPANPPALIQIATETKCLLFQTRKTTDRNATLPNGLVALLRNPAIQKVGVGLRNDIQSLPRTWPELGSLNGASFVDIGGNRVGVVKLALDTFNYVMPKPKKVTLSDWSAITLNERQIQYAAADAWVALRVHQRTQQPSTSAYAAFAPQNAVPEAGQAPAPQQNERAAPPPSTGDRGETRREGRRQDDHQRRSQSGDRGSVASAAPSMLTIENVESLVSRIRADPTVVVSEVIDSPHQWHYFGCQTNRSHWWRKVPVRKPVSRCGICHLKFDPIPRDQWVGHGLFRCKCGQVWTNGASRFSTRQPCYGCGAESAPIALFPTPRNSVRKTKRRHHCEECRGDGTCPVSERMRRRAEDGPWSKHHVSTGSTIASALIPQTIFGITVDANALVDMFEELGIAEQDEPDY